MAILKNQFYAKFSNTQQSLISKLILTKLTLSFASFTSIEK